LLLIRRAVVQVLIYVRDDACFSFLEETRMGSGTTTEGDVNTRNGIRMAPKYGDSNRLSVITMPVGDDECQVLGHWVTAMMTC
jgi:hypothetical protein